MKGIVFTEFLEMVESSFGYEMVDNLLSEGDLPSGGAYTAVGTYDHEEMVTLVTRLSERTKTPVPQLLKAYGLYLFGTFQKAYPQFLAAAPDAFTFLESIDQYIHVEVRKLYPDAELPHFSTNRLSDTQLEMIYTSERAMGHFAAGLIEKSLEHYGQKGNVSMSPISEDGRQIRFLIETTEA